MEVISFRCPACKQVLRIGADKAGRKGKCKCGAEVVVPSTSEAAAPAAAAPPPLPATVDADEEEGGTYNLIGDFAQPAAPKEEPRKRGDDDEDDDDDDEDGVARPGPLIIGEKDRPKGTFRITRARRLLNPAKWLKVCSGLNIIAIGLWVWLGAMALREIPVIIGLFNPSDYSKLRLRWEDPRLYAQLAREGSAEDVKLSKTEFMYGLVTGNDPVTAGLWLFRLSALLLIGASGTLLVGYGICLAVPPRFGTVGLVYTLLALGSVNLVLTIVFRLLPTFGVMDYVLIPVAVPEIPWLDANIERELPLSVSLTALPFLDYTLSFLVLGVYFLEPVVLGMFVRAIALSMKAEELEEVGTGMVRLGLGVAFIWLGYMTVMVTGSSEVLLWLLRVVYVLGTTFFLGQLAWFAVEVMKIPPLIQSELDVTEIETEEKRKDEDEDEDEDED
jgi:hypothetical protein